MIVIGVKRGSLEGTGSNWRGHGEPLVEMGYVFLLFLPKGIGF